MRRTAKAAKNLLVFSINGLDFPVFGVFAGKVACIGNSIDAFQEESIFVFAATVSNVEKSTQENFIILRACNQPEASGEVPACQPNLVGLVLRANQTSARGVQQICLPGR